MKARTLLIIFATLIIGVFLGILISAQIRYQKLKPVRTFFSEEMFRNSIYGTIKPEEPQKAKIEEIIGRYAIQNMKMQSDFRDEFDTMMKDFWSEIEPNLTKDQLARLKEMEDKRTEMFNRPQVNRPPRDSNNFGNVRQNPGDSLRFGVPQGFQHGMPLDSLRMRDTTLRRPDRTKIVAPARVQ